jgi:hypothetical protein
MKKQILKPVIVIIFIIFSILCSINCAREKGQDIEAVPKPMSTDNDIPLAKESYHEDNVENIERYEYLEKSQHQYYESLEFFPSFPWPPPPASAIENLDPNLLKNLVCLGDVDTCIGNALKAAGYVEKSYYYVPGGFALVTRLEQINDDGIPKALPDRWSVDVPPLKKFDLTSYLKALFTSNKGYFRIIVFIITPYPFKQAEERIALDGALEWLRKGVNKLPPAISARKFIKEYTVSALIYEFEKPKAGKAVPLLPGRLTCHIHLLNSGILKALEG